MYAVLTISIGAMVGSGIFVLPGLAATLAGPGIVLAYLVAGIVVLPAAFSQSEMATAMPHAGGTYLYIDRAMGPLMGTIAGVGVWFSLVFKSAFALDGLGEYLQLGFDRAPVGLVAIALGAILIIVNVNGVKSSGRVQAVIVSVVLTVLVTFVLVGLTNIEPSHFEPFLPEGIGGLLAAAGIVFVSYAGVTKIASVAEEVKRPTRTIPRAILSSIALMMVLYPAIAFVIVGVTPPELLNGSTTPIALAAEIMGGRGAELVVSVVAVLALLSMANAGILASSRYPFAMSRNALAPQALSKVGRSGVPVYSVLLTGGTMLLLIAVFPILELAKLASAFQLLVFMSINLALIAFRESKLDWYRPVFRSPLYPWTQIFGILAPIVLLSQMGIVPILGAALIVIGGVIWYRIFGRSRTNPESAWFDALRVRAMGRLVTESRDELSGPNRRRVLIPVPGGINDRRLDDLLRTVALVAEHDAWVRVVRVDRPGPDGGLRRGTEDDEVEFDDRVLALAPKHRIALSVMHATGRHRRNALADTVRDDVVDLVLSELPSGVHRGFAADMEWLGDRALCDFAYLGNRYLEEIDDVAVLGSGGPLDPLKVYLAGRIAEGEGAEIRFVHVLADHASGRQVHSMQEYHSALAEVVDVPTHSEVVQSDALVPELAERVRSSDLVIMGALRSRFRVLTDLVDRIRERVDAPVLLVRTHELGRRPSLAGRVLERLLR